MSEELERLSQKVIEIGQHCSVEQPKLEASLAERIQLFQTRYGENGPGIEMLDQDHEPSDATISWRISIDQAESRRARALASLCSLLETILEAKQRGDPAADWRHHFSAVLQAFMAYCAALVSLRQCVEAEDRDLLLLREHDAVADRLHACILRNYAQFNDAVQALERHEQRTGLRAPWQVKYSFLPTPQSSSSSSTPVSDDPTVELRGDVVSKYGYSVFSEYCVVTRRKLPREGPRVRSLARRAVACPHVVADHLRVLRLCILNDLPFATGIPNTKKSNDPTPNNTTSQGNDALFFLESRRLVLALHHLDPLVFSWGGDTPDRKMLHSARRLSPLLPDQLFVDALSEQSKVLAFSAASTGAPSPPVDARFSLLSALLPSDPDRALLASLLAGDALNRTALALFALNHHLPLFGMLGDRALPVGAAAAQLPAVAAALDAVLARSPWPSAHPLHGAAVSLHTPAMRSRSYWLSHWASLVIILRTIAALQRQFQSMTHDNNNDNNNNNNNNNNDNASSTSDVKVALWAENRPEWYLVDMAVTLCGGLAARDFALYTTATHCTLPASSVVAILRPVSPRILATTLACLQSASDLAQLIEGLPSLGLILLLDSPQSLPPYLCSTQHNIRIVSFFSAEFLGSDFPSFLEISPSQTELISRFSQSASSSLHDAPASPLVPPPPLPLLPPVHSSEMCSPFTLMFSSGSTQSPKAIMISRKQWCSDLQDSTNHRYLNPLVSVSFLSSAWATDREGVWRIFARFGSVGFPVAPSPSLLRPDCASPVPSASLETALLAFRAFRPHMLSAPPAVWEFLLDQLQLRHPVDPLSDLWRHPYLVNDLVDQPAPFFRLTPGDQRCLSAFRKLLGGRCVTCGSGGAALGHRSESLLRRLLWPDNFSIAYGTTEIGGVLQDGHVLPNVEVKLVSVPELGLSVHDLPHPRGELFARSKTSQHASIVTGYVRANRLASCFDLEGWYHTADLFTYLPHSRRYVFLGRANDQFKTARGEWVIPAEIERVVTAQLAAAIPTNFVSGLSEFPSPHMLLDAALVPPDPAADAHAHALCSVSAKGVWLVPRAADAHCADLPPDSPLAAFMQAHFYACRQLLLASLQSAQVPDVYSVALGTHPWSPANAFLLPSYKINRPQLASTFGSAIHRTLLHHQSLSPDLLPEPRPSFPHSQVSFEVYQRLLARSQLITASRVSQLLTTWLTEQIASLLGSSHVDPHRSLGEMGGTSVTAVSSRLKLQNEIDSLLSKLPAGVAITHTIFIPQAIDLLRLSLNQIVERIVDQTHPNSLNLFAELIQEIYHSQEILSNSNSNTSSNYILSNNSSSSSSSSNNPSSSELNNSLSSDIDAKPSIQSLDDLEFTTDQTLEITPHIAFSTKIGSASIPSHETKNHAILLFGATGFVGSAIVAQFLLDRPSESHSLIAVVRARSGLEAAERLSRLLLANETPLQPLMESVSPQIARLHDGVWVVAGDLTEPQFGWTEATYQWIVERAACVINSAVYMNFCQGYRAHKEVNVNSMDPLMRLCLQLPTARPHLVHISTLSVFGTATVCREDSPTPAEALQRADGYSRSKWMAERLLLGTAAHLQGSPLSVSIVRLGLIGYHSSTGIGCARDWPSRLLRAVLILRIAPAAHKDAGLAFVSCDGAARVILEEAARAEASSWRTLHVTNKHLSASGSIRFSLLWDLLILHGFLDHVVEWPVWESALVSAGMDTPSPSAACFTPRQQLLCQDLVPLLPFFQAMLPLPGPYTSTLISYDRLPPLYEKPLLQYINWLLVQ